MTALSGKRTQGMRNLFSWEMGICSRIMSDAVICEIKQTITEYLALAPAAGDTLEGIRAWWLDGHHCSQGVLLSALRELEREGLIRHVGSSDGGCWVGPVSSAR